MMMSIVEGHRCRPYLRDCRKDVCMSAVCCTHISLHVRLARQYQLVQSSFGASFDAAHIYIIFKHMPVITTLLLQH